MGPRPSTVGTPSPAVVLASEAPPVAASLSSKPRRRASATATSTSAVVPADFSIGQALALSSTTHVTSGTVVDDAMRRTSASASSSAARVTARRSTSRRASAGTTLGRVPPLTTPTLTVTPGQRPLRAVRASALCAASTIALRPLSGSMPACAARPVISRVRSAMPLRELTMSPLARASSRTKAKSLDFACSLMTGLLTGEPISSSGLATNTSRPKGNAPATDATAATACRPASNPAFMSATPGPWARVPSSVYRRRATVPSG